MKRTVKNQGHFLKGFLVEVHGENPLPIWHVRVADDSSDLNGELLMVQTIAKDYDGYTLSSEMKVVFLVAPFSEKGELRAIEVQPVTTIHALDSGLIELTRKSDLRPKMVSFIISKERESFYVDYYDGDNPDEAQTWLYERYPSRDFIYIQSFYPDPEELDAFNALVALLKIKTDEPGSLGGILQIVLGKLFECGVVHIRKKLRQLSL